MKQPALGEVHHLPGVEAAEDMIDQLRHTAVEAEHQLLGYVPEGRRNPVTKIEPAHGGEPKPFKHGVAYMDIVTLENDRTYQVVSGVPNKPRTDIPVFIGTALGTTIHGHNWHTMLDMMELGFPVVMVGPEGGHRNLPKTPRALKRYLQNLARISIGETGANMHEIFDAYDENPEYKPFPYQSGVVLKTGESRDGAVGMSFVAQAGQFDREVADTYLIAPPFPLPKPLKAGPELIPRTVEIFEQVGSIALHAGANGPRRLRHYPKTLCMDPLFAMHVAATVPTLVSGAAGRYARRIPHDSRMYMVHYDRDPWTSIEGWKEVLDSDEYPHVVQDVRSGNHGDIVHPDTQEHRVAHFRRLSDELAKKKNALELVDWEQVYFGGQIALAAA